MLMNGESRSTTVGTLVMLNCQSRDEDLLGRMHDQQSRKAADFTTLMDCGLTNEMYAPESGILSTVCIPIISPILHKSFLPWQSSHINRLGVVSTREVQMESSPHNKNICSLTTGKTSTTEIELLESTPVV